MNIMIEHQPKLNSELKPETRDLYKSVFDLQITNEPSPIETEKTAIIIAPGGGNQHSRLEVDWKKYANTVLVAGTRKDPDYGPSEVAADPPESKMLKHLTKLSKTAGDKEYIHDVKAGRVDIPDEIVFKIDAIHTPDQTDWAVAEIMDRPNIDRVILSTASYHLPRFTLTFIKSWLKNGDKNRKFELRVIPTFPTEAPDQSTNTNISINGELMKIEEYQEKDNVATTYEFEEFLANNSERGN